MRNPKLWWQVLLQRHGCQDHLRGHVSIERLLDVHLCPFAGLSCGGFSWEFRVCGLNLYALCDNIPLHKRSYEEVLHM